MSRDTAFRPITDDEYPAWLTALATGFLRPPVITDEEVALRRKWFAADRVYGAFDGARCVGTYRSFDQQVTVPGGAFVSANAVSNVTVSATHRRRGLLSKVIAEDLAAAKERGDVVSTLIAAEYPIYGRYGFGPAAHAAEWAVDLTRAGLDPRYAAPPQGAVELVDGAAVRELGPEVHERFRAVQPGAVSRRPGWWTAATGTEGAAPGWKQPFYAVYRDAAGEVQGLVSYTVDVEWERSGLQPTGKAEVHAHFATTPEADRALWLYLFSVDWVTEVVTGHRAPDDLLPSYLGDPRAARMALHADTLWIRPLDVPRLLESRTYGTPGSLVLDLHDKAGLASGRFLLEAEGPAGAAQATCTPTTRTADLTLGAGDLAALSLGDESAVRLAALGRVTEERAGAAAAADGLLRTSRRPWCPDIF
ncbi:GNAT family N-acetyltransferase [Streptomyces sp. A7024]|uniref:GNAT family N-acetyltransferase n=1 Tax=Streptomyces coryli TaxID=1128680 RepID=A0A6G4TYH6_9ACTN|nr:GNAT family N-acetyltransferase [Streptomyces coryli]NGN64087.1 GNAT family N-acetyltransferase [Streptomyces coryli]